MKHHEWKPVRKKQRPEKQTHKEIGKLIETKCKKAPFNAFQDFSKFKYTGEEKAY